MPRKTHARVSPGLARRRLLQRRVLELRRTDLSWREIARELGISHEYARRLYRALYEEVSGSSGAPDVRAEARAPDQLDAKKELVSELLELRAQGLSIRQIAGTTERSKSQVHRLIVAGYEATSRELFSRAVLVLGEMLDRLDGLSLAANRVLADPGSSTNEKLRAISEIRRCSDAKIGLTAGDDPGAAFELSLSLEELIAQEVAEMTEEQVDRELNGFGWCRVRNETPETPDQAASLAPSA